MSGSWVQRKQDEHVCAKPKHEQANERVHVGDQWRCDECGTRWRVRDVWRGDQREPLLPGERPVLSFERVSTYSGWDQRDSAMGQDQR